MNTKDETMMVHAFRKDIVPGPFSESLMRNCPKTFIEIRRRTVAHIAWKGKLTRSARVWFPRARVHQVDLNP